MRQINAKSLQFIERWEQLRLDAYQDGAGVWTIGYGHTGPDVREDMTIDDARADALMREDLRTACDAVESMVRVALTDNQFGALVSFTFNAGVSAFRMSTLRRVLNAGRYNEVPAQLARWVFITNPVNGRKARSQGLVNRRAAEAALWRST